MKRVAYLSRGLIVTLAVALAAQVPLVQAEIVDTQAMSVQSQAEQDRAKVQSFVERANVKERLQAMGVSGLVAKDRVASLSEEEVHALAQRIDSMPAGGALSSTDWILILLVAILVAIAI
ncbi:PA2779 family protein [Ramlibacter sp. 2FC]|uniref:PA2779 family protein n=1 Tax=Ramlibacter sp. 2FC TaxID=2502188 RepID=UPI0010F8A5F5|nr:PA2779 family protein [Ramlibacter sp. 2FC]